MNNPATSYPAFEVRPEPLSFQQWLCRALPPILSYRLATRVFWRNRPRTGERFVTTAMTGALFSYRSGDLLADQVRMCGFWDWRAHVIAAVFSSPGDTIIEVGANTGTETVGFASIVGPAGKVVAFEPIPNIANALRFNANINGYRQIDVIEAAVSELAGMVSVQEPTSRANSGQAYVTNDGSGIRVPAVRLDDLIDRLGAATAMFFDVEGHEVSALRGSQEYIRRFEPVLVVEAVSVQLQRAGSSIGELADQLTSMNYVVFQINRISVTKLDLRNCNADYHHNWLCVKSSVRDAIRCVNAHLVACAFAPGIFKPLKFVRRKSVAGSFTKKADPATH